MLVSAARQVDIAVRPLRSLATVWNAQHRGKFTGKSRFNLKRRLAAEQHVDYTRQMDGPASWPQIDLDPTVHRRIDQVRQVFNSTEVMAPPSDAQQLISPRQALQREFDGLRGSVDFQPFGRISVEHGDIFAADADVVILPMTANLMPYRGISLEAFDRGGEDLVQQTFKNAKKRYGEAGLDAGDTIIVDGRGVQAEHILFVVLPWFWQGSPMDAGKRLRFCAQRAFSNVEIVRRTSGRPLSVVLPSLGSGVYGFEPRGSCHTLVDEAVEALLQIEASVPNYAMKAVRFIDSNQDTVEELYGALTHASHRWLPERRLTTAAQYAGAATRRLMVLPAVPHFFWKKHRVKFKRSHGVAKKERRHYLSNVRAILWRAQRVRQPPPLMVYKQPRDDGPRQMPVPAPMEMQKPARPLYYRGVSHVLFPSRKIGFHQLRKGSQGQWIAKLQNYRLRDDIRPRM